MKTETPINERIAQLLERVAKLTTADKLKPTKFDARGERHARSVAAADGERGGKKAAGPSKNHPGRVA